jgi:hypothetical protein
MYVNGKRTVETIPGMEGRKNKEWCRAWIQLMIYCKNSCKCHNVHHYNNNKK